MHNFLSQHEPCIHKEANFEYLTPIDFDCIVDIKKPNDKDDEDDKQKEKTTEWHRTGKNRPLKDQDCKGVVRIFFCTTVIKK